MKGPALPPALDDVRRRNSGEAEEGFDDEMEPSSPVWNGVGRLAIV
jgi:hypothetical protein